MEEALDELHLLLPAVPSVLLMPPYGYGVAPEPEICPVASFWKDADSLYPASACQADLTVSLPTTWWGAGAAEEEPNRN
jgi:hypothetical protein